MAMSSVFQPRSDLAASTALASLNVRSRDIFKRIVDSYLSTGEPVGSRNLSLLLPTSLSPASVRNVMQELERLGLIYSPHTSAGRLPTHLGLRFFVDALLEWGDLGEDERRRIDAEVRAASQARTVDGVLSEAMGLLSGLTRGAGIVVTGKDNQELKHIEFVRLDAERALVILVGADGSVENRVIMTPPDLPVSGLIEAANYLNARIKGRTLATARAEIEAERHTTQTELDELSNRVVDAGLASWAGLQDQDRRLIVRGQGNLLEDLTALEDLERIRLLFDDLETKTEVIELLDRAEKGEGVKIFIGAENKLFSLSGSSMVTTPLRDREQTVIGVLGIIGPTRLNYARVVPMVDYTARVISQFIGRM
jgi:heat-inducible transcriptional repressor